MKLCRECFRLCDLFELRQKFAMMQGQVFRDPIIGHEFGNVAACKNEIEMVDPVVVFNQAHLTL